MHTNFLEVIPENEYKVYIENYSDERLNELRNTNNDVYSFFRYKFNNNDKTYIVAFPLTSDNNPCDFSTVKIVKATDEPFLTNKIIHELLLREIVKLGRCSSKYKPITFLSEKKQTILL